MKGIILSEWISNSGTDALNPVGAWQILAVLAWFFLLEVVQVMESLPRRGMMEHRTLL